MRAASSLRLCRKGECRTSGILDAVTSLYAGGMSVCDTARHCRMGIELSHDTISRITDGVLADVRAWQHRPLEGRWVGPGRTGVR